MRRDSETQREIYLQDIAATQLKVIWNWFSNWTRQKLAGKKENEYISAWISVSRETSFNIVSSWDDVNSQHRRNHSRSNAASVQTHDVTHKKVVSSTNMKKY